MKTYRKLRKFSDKSIPEAMQICSKYLHSKLSPTLWIDDTTKCIDLIFDLPKSTFAHRSRVDKGFPINDITIKTKSKYGYYNGEKINVEYDKLCEYDMNGEFNLFYFYCQFNEENNKISRYILFDLKKLIQHPDFKNKKMFGWKEDKYNSVDGGSYFNKINISTLYKYDCVLVNECEKGLRYDDDGNKY